jgi:protein tyrosine phosphatase (PTP) superfamily phosphohydrolase (DUF442 family)
MPATRSAFPPQLGRLISLRVQLYGWITGLALGLVIHGTYILCWGNLHTVLPSRVYRCGQLSGDDLEKTILDYGIRTVVNLRGYSPALPWYQEESQATHHLNVCQEDICFSANRLPSFSELRRLVQVFDRTEYPILLHCRHGADRTGLASVVVLLLQSNVGLDQARRELGLRFGHLPLGRQAYLDRFVDLYADWLESHRWEHSAEHFRQWIAEDSFPGEGRCRLELLQGVERIRLGEPTALKVRFYNDGEKPWHFRAATNAGIHAGFILFDELDCAIAYGRGALMDTEVAPGQSRDVTLVLPAIRRPGNYRVLVDMVEEQQGWFHQFGSEPLELRLTVSGQ